jgi:hypothetical protein
MSLCRTTRTALHHTARTALHHTARTALHHTVDMMRHISALAMLVVAAVAAASTAQASLSAVPEPAIEWVPRSYVCLRAPGPVTIDGNIEEPAWSMAPWTEPFVDIRGGATACPRVPTRAKMLWDDEFLYIAADMEEPNLWGTLTARDAVIYHDNDFEVFIDPDGDTHEYYELEVNTLGTEWDLLLVRPYRDGAPAVDAWDIQGLETAVRLDGTLNDPADYDVGWTVEIAIPWSVLDDCAHRPSPPVGGDRWRVNFSRVQWQLEVEDGSYVKAVDPETGDPLPEDNWVWSPQGLVAMHYPEMWAFVEFWDVPAGASSVAFPKASAANDQEKAAWALRLVYYRERNRFADTGGFTTILSELGLDTAPSDGYTWPPAISVTPNGFEASVVADDGALVRIDEHGRVVSEPVD